MVKLMRGPVGVLSGTLGQLSVIAMFHRATLKLVVRQFG